MNINNNKEIQKRTILGQQAGNIVNKESTSMAKALKVKELGSNAYSLFSNSTKAVDVGTGVGGIVTGAGILMGATTIGPMMAGVSGLAYGLYQTGNALNAGYKSWTTTRTLVSGNNGSADLQALKISAEKELIRVHQRLEFNEKLNTEIERNISLVEARLERAQKYVADGDGSFNSIVHCCQGSLVQLRASLKSLKLATANLKGSIGVLEEIISVFRENQAGSKMELIAKLCDKHDRMFTAALANINKVQSSEEKGIALLEKAELIEEQIFNAFRQQAHHVVLLQEELEVAQKIIAEQKERETTKKIAEDEAEAEAEAEVEVEVEDDFEVVSIAPEELELFDRAVEKESVMGALSLKGSKRVIIDNLIKPRLEQTTAEGAQVINLNGPKLTVNFAASTGFWGQFAGKASTTVGTLNIEYGNGDSTEVRFDFNREDVISPQDLLIIRNTILQGLKDESISLMKAKELINTLKTAEIRRGDSSARGFVKRLDFADIERRLEEEMRESRENKRRS